MDWKRYLDSVNKKSNIPGKPIVEIAGQNRVLIENHQGVLAYSLEEVQIKVSYGKLVIQGRNLRLLHLSKEQLVVNGHIDSVNLFGR